MTKHPAAVTPEAQTSDYVDEWWMLRHQAKLNEVKLRQGDIDLLMIGDSITQGWEDEESSGRLWQEYFEPRNALNLGFNGDRTEQVLWRLQNGAIDELVPKAIVLLIGTNNTGHRQDPAEDTAAGIKAILQELQTRLPKTPIVLFAIFPCGESTTDPSRRLNTDINDMIANYADGRDVHFLDISHRFVHDTGQLRTDLMPDLLHLSPAGYKIWAECMLPLLDELLAEDRSKQS